MFLDIFSGVQYLCMEKVEGSQGEAKRRACCFVIFSTKQFFLHLQFTISQGRQSLQYPIEVDCDHSLFSSDPARGRKLAIMQIHAKMVKNVRSIRRALRKYWARRLLTEADILPLRALVSVVF